MKRILIQLDSDRFASTFDFIVANDAGVDVVQSYSGISPEDVRGLILGALFPRGVPDLKTLAAWIGGSDVDVGERILEEAQRTFFGPFKISLMLDSNGCNTTASTAIALLARQIELQGRSALVIGPGAVGVRAAVLLASEGCRVRLAAIPAELLGDRFNKDLALRTFASGCKAAEVFRGRTSAAAGGSMQMADAASFQELEDLLNKTEILVAAGPAGFRLIPQQSWKAKANLKYLLDFNLTEPLGIEGLKPGDAFADYGGKSALGALAIGNPKMKLHKACIEKLFERNDLVLDVEAVYRIARQLLQ